jgi:hypothetical protein
VSKERQDEKEKIDTTIYGFTWFIHKMYADMDWKIEKRF